MGTLESFRVFACKYASRPSRRGDNFFGGDSQPDVPMPMDYFVWAAVSPERTVVIDTGFSGATALKRDREHLREPAAALKLLGIDAAEVTDVVVSHLHYDHAGTVDDFPRARFHLQADELSDGAGDAIGSQRRRSYEIDDIVSVVRALHAGRVQLHQGDTELAPGFSLHLVPGHTPGMQVARIHTARGWLVLASDASHYYENFESDRAFATVFDAEKAVAAFRDLRSLAASTQHIIPGHDPLVMSRYPAPRPELEGIVVQLDAAPVNGPHGGAGQFGVRN